MRRGHGRAAGKSIATVAGIITRARVSARSRNIRLGAVAAVPGNRAAAAKAGNGIRSGSQGPDCVGRRIKRRRIGDGGTGGAGVTRRDYHLDTGSFLSFDRGLQLVANYTALR